MTVIDDEETAPTNPSGSKFRDFYNKIVAEAQIEGPEAVAHLGALHRHFRIGPKGTRDDQPR
jgi:hypothetical protein